MASISGALAVAINRAFKLLLWVNLHLTISYWLLPISLSMRHYIQFQQLSVYSQMGHYLLSFA